MSEATTIKTRFAPSPTGLVHMGNVRTALFNYLFATNMGGEFMIRCEDTDLERSKDEYLQSLLEDLGWLGLSWSEGPDVGGAYAPYRQSERLDIYKKYYDELADLGDTYPCYCTDQELKVARKSMLNAGEPPRYSGTCSRLSAEERANREAAGVKPSIRFKVPENDTISFDDLVRGTQTFNAADIGDFVIQRSDGTPAFFFCNAIDDALMGVTHVMRGEDHLTNTPRQLMLLKRLGLREPTYGHISMIVGQDGAKLSKRHGSQSLQAMRADGYFPSAITNHLARLGLAMSEGALLSLEELAKRFDVAKLGKAPARHDSEQLDHWQQEALKAVSDEEVWAWMQRADAAPTISANVKDKQRMAFVQLVRDNLKTPNDAVKWADRLSGLKPTYSKDALKEIENAAPNFFGTALDALPNVSDFKSLAQEVSSTLDVKGKALYMPLRAAITGEIHGPDMTQVFAFLGQDKVRERLELAVSMQQKAA